MIRTGWLPSALGPGQENDEAQERFGLHAVEVRREDPEGRPGSYWEVRLTGEFENVVRAVSDWWQSGSDVDDIEFLQAAVKEFEVYESEEDRYNRLRAELLAAEEAEAAAYANYQEAKRKTFAVLTQTYKHEDQRKHLREE